VGVKRAQVVVAKMGSTTIIEEKKIEETIKNIPKDSFTALDSTEVFRRTYPEEWKRIVERSARAISEKHV
jgi:Txe/YoeB family toxin of Txe-Axe toxin-antitoxin module